jgi:hypothetical protein
LDKDYVNKFMKNSKEFEKLIDSIYKWSIEVELSMDLINRARVYGYYDDRVPDEAVMKL